MKENLSIVRLLHFLSVTLIVAICVGPKNPILRWPGADAIIKSGRSSLQIFCAGAILTVIINLIVAVDRPSSIERLILDCAAIAFVAWLATMIAAPAVRAPAASPLVRPSPPAHHRRVSGALR
jgi:hypothetical protein